MQPYVQLDIAENRARKGNRGDRILGIAKILGVERANLPEGVSLYVEVFDFKIQRRPGNSVFRRRTSWPSNFSVAFGKSPFNEFLLIVPYVL